MEILQIVRGCPGNSFDVKSKMGAVGKPTAGCQLECRKQRQSMNFSDIDLAQIHTGFVGIRQVLAIGRNCGGVHRGFNWIGGEATLGSGAPVAFTPEIPQA
jgi:hypothetical protein